jgi:citrate synthase
MSKNAELGLDGRVYELPVCSGTEGNRAIDVSRLRTETGHITLDEGYGNTGSATSQNTYIDGERGILGYRGYPVEELAERCDYKEESSIRTSISTPGSAKRRSHRDLQKESYQVVTRLWVLR